MTFTTSGRRARRTVALLLGVACMLIAGCGGSSEQRETSGEPSSDVAGVRETRELLDGIAQADLVLGKPDAPVTMVEIVDLQCPFCRAHQLDVQPKLINELVRSGRLRIVLVPVAFLGPDSQRMEIVMLRLSRLGVAWQFANLAFWNQGREGSGYATDGWLRRIVAEVPGTDDAAASTTPDRAIVQAASAAKLIAERGMASVGGAGTPFFMLGKTGTPLWKLTPILAGAPPNAYDVIARAVKRVERGQDPEPLTPAAPQSTPAGAGEA